MQSSFSTSDPESGLGAKTDGWFLNVHHQSVGCIPDFSFDLMARNTQQHHQIPQTLFNQNDLLDNHPLK